jgi:hypothetical protein
LLEVHGANLEGQPEEFRNRVLKLITRLQDREMIRWAGPYDRDELPRRMARRHSPLAGP